MPAVSGFFDDEDVLPTPRRRKCWHCFVWVEVRTGEFAIACGHGCGKEMRRWISTDAAREAQLAAESQENFVAAHEGGCPHARRWQ